MTGAPPPPPPPPPPAGGAPPPPPHGPYGQPFGGPVAPPPQGSNGMAIASLVLGIASLPLCFLFIPGVLAIVFGFIALSQTRATGQKGRGMAITGLILGGLSVVAIVLAIVFVGAFELDTALAAVRLVR